MRKIPFFTPLTAAPAPLPAWAGRRRRSPDGLRLSSQEASKSSIFRYRGVLKAGSLDRFIYSRSAVPGSTAFSGFFCTVKRFYLSARHRMLSHPEIVFFLKIDPQCWRRIKSFSQTNRNFWSNTSLTNANFIERVPCDPKIIRQLLKIEIQRLDIMFIQDHSRMKRLSGFLVHIWRTSIINWLVNFQEIVLESPFPRAAGMANIISLFVFRSFCYTFLAYVQIQRVHSKVV